MAQTIAIAAPLSTKVRIDSIAILPADRQLYDLCVASDDTYHMKRMASITESTLVTRKRAGVTESIRGAPLSHARMILTPPTVATTRSG